MENLKEIRLNRSVLPDYDDINWRSQLKKLGLGINFLLDDGVILSYDSQQYEAVIIGQDGVDFYDPKTKSLVVSYVENFGYIEFIMYGEEEPFIKIPILETYDQ